MEMQDINTHEKINQSLCGKPVELTPGHSIVELETTPDMEADGSGLVHGGFIFGLADYAAMIAINHPFVVLGASTVKFLKPIKSGAKVVAEANADTLEGKKRVVSVIVKLDDSPVFEGEFTCFVLDKHVLG